MINVPLRGFVKIAFGDWGDSTLIWMMLSTQVIEPQAKGSVR
jgi:hypothetical protein